MKDEAKTKKQLIEELGELRRKLSEPDKLDSERRRDEEALRESEERFRTIFDSARDGFYVIDLEGRYMSVNDAGCAIFGYTHEEFLNSDVRMLFFPEDVEDVFNKYGKMWLEGGFLSDLRLHDKDGVERYVDINITPLHIGGENFALGIVRDITERKQMEDELNKLVITDKLTKAYNRVKFEEIIAIEMERATRYDHPLSILIIDIDDFKNVNDTCGHLAGDYVLKAVADILQSHMRKLNHLIRWGGDEFIIVPVETGLDGASIFSERLRQAIESFDFGKAGKITVSIGIALFNKDDTEDTFLKRADDALYKAKASGGNRVETSV
jgi:diguanylate cyclase (GGDEF)-like protein/PAS domain S-box-containing protein